ncbi:hypothetical protein F0L74_15780 [Chitinophaga agrisoli]|uniref:Uncharacterized protein n=1 Tax=Chitinophaga agrisoli TaxID=2607653 RepID=A0A5B2VQC6_9BACT|nr:hypothetical protein [Chitinophaga agrisoli]KAA2241361.1 hypothetical protein F0L74_15780 [Chitinophaga agrisoli]
MKHPIPYVLLLACSLTSCYSLKFRKDKQDIKWITRHQAFIRSLSDSAIALAGPKGKQIDFDTLADGKLKKDLSRLGYSVHVEYTSQFGSGDSIARQPVDSIVTFEQTGVLLGDRMLILDFSKQPRTYPDDFSDIGNYLFIQVAPKIYYYRRPVPMM